MFGKTIGNTPYYSCQPRSNNPRLPKLSSSHPSATNVRKDALLEGVLKFLAERIFGEHRREALDNSLLKIEQRDQGLSEPQRRSFQKKIDALDARKTRLLRALENDGDPGGIMFRQIRDRMIEMEAERTTAAEELAQLQELAQPQDPERPQDPHLLDFLPVGEICRPVSPPLELHRLLESLRLQLHYDHETQRVRCRVALRSESIDDVLAASADVVRSVVDVFGAPGEN